ncbi:MAG: hydroxyethylthiazole kinase [Clostridiales bacterium]|nr:hydroxyethylthiazole kinase [Clostridiales bacterium]
MLKDCIENVRKKAPLVHNITNYVTVNDVANNLLACGASPIMADDLSEVEEITSICGGLNINIGTLSKNTVSSMLLAGKKANELGHKVLLDPVGAGASEMRTKTSLQIMSDVKLNVIRGNISEIKTLALGSAKTQGVDANDLDTITQSTFESSISFIKDFAKKMTCIVVVTGAIDIVTDGDKCYIIKNGVPEMTKITGTGCQLSAMIVAFLVANPKNELEATVSAVCAMGLAGEIAWKNMQNGDGNSTYRNRIIDAIYNMDGKILEDGARYEIA